jgi:hypothetical protein
MIHREIGILPPAVFLATIAITSRKGLTLGVAKYVIPAVLSIKVITVTASFRSAAG